MCEYVPVCVCGSVWMRRGKGKKECATRAKASEYNEMNIWSIKKTLTWKLPMYVWEKGRDKGRPTQATQTGGRRKSTRQARRVRGVVSTFLLYSHHPFANVLSLLGLCNLLSLLDMCDT